MEQPAEISGARVLEKAFDVLYSFESHCPEQSLFDISRKLKFPPSTTRRILKVLMARRLIQQNAATNFIVSVREFFISRRLPGMGWISEKLPCRSWSA